MTDINGSQEFPELERAHADSLRSKEDNPEDPSNNYAYSRSIRSPSQENPIETKEDIKSPEEIEPNFDKIILQGYTKSNDNDLMNSWEKNPKEFEESLEQQIPAIEVNSKPETIEIEKIPSISEATVEDVKLPSPVRSFRPPITPANSLGYALPKRKDTPKSERYQSLKETKIAVKKTYPTPTDRMRSSSAQPRPTAIRFPTPSHPPPSRKLPLDDAKSPSLPVTPKPNKKYENVKSRINANSDHKPSGGNVKIFHQPVKFNVASKIGSLDNAKHVAGGGHVKIENHKINFKEIAKPRIDAKGEARAPKAEKRIITHKLEWKAEAKIGSLDNANHKPPGGDVKISDYQVPTTTPKSRSKASDSINSIGSYSSINNKS